VWGMYLSLYVCGNWVAWDTTGQKGCSQSCYLQRGWSLQRNMPNRGHFTKALHRWRALEPNRCCDWRCV